MATRIGKPKVQQIKICRKNPATSDNAKVKVQWIQNHQIVDKAQKQQEHQTTPQPQEQQTGAITEELVENVEYLDEAAAAQTTDESIAATDCKAGFVDTFYANAVQCLIMLYGIKYGHMRQTGACAERAIWTEISQDMNECYFVFDAEQVRQKFHQLRQQYFQLATTGDLKAWQHFDQMHGIYGDPRIKALASGLKECDTAAATESQVYIDEALYHEVEDDKEAEIEAFPYGNVQNHEETATMPEEVSEAQEVVVDTENSTRTPQQHVENLEREDVFHEVEKQLKEMEESNSQSNDKLHFSKEMPQQAEDDLVSNEMIQPHHQEEIVHDVDDCEKEAVVQAQEEQAPPPKLQQLQKPPTAKIQKICIKQEPKTLEERPKPSELSSAIQPQTKRFKLDLPAGVTTEVLRQQHNSPNLVHLQTKEQLQQQPAATQRMMPFSAVLTSVVPTNSTSSSSSSTEFSPLSLSEYNAAQERRHCEKIELLRQSLALQERSIEIQRELMERLINRL